MSRRCVLGVRVSTDDKDQDPRNQLLPLRAAVARHGWTVTAEVVIEGLSGWDRKEAANVRRQLLAPIRSGEADTLCVWALDRVTRGGAKDTLLFLAELEEHLGGQLFSLQEPFLSTAALDPALREFMVSTVAYLARRESDHKSSRVRAKVEAKRNRAGALGQSAKWGRGVLATPEQESAVLRLRGQSVRRIADEVGISKSQVARIMQRVPRGPSGQAGLDTVQIAPSSGARLGQGVAGGAQS